MYTIILLFLPSPVVFLCRRRVFLVWFLLQCGQRTCRCIISCVRGSWDVRGASYGRGKPQKLALFRGVPILKKVEEALAHLSLCAEHFCLRHSLAPSDIQLLHEYYFIRHIFLCVNGTNKRKSLASPPGGTCRPPEGEPCIIYRLRLRLRPGLQYVRQASVDRLPTPKSSAAPWALPLLSSHPMLLS